MPTRTYRPIHVATLASGMDLVLPLHEIVGDKPGPTLGISAGIHGEEAVGAEVVYRFMQSLDPSALRGRLLVLPVANPFSYAATSRHTPSDGARGLQGLVSILGRRRRPPGDPPGPGRQRVVTEIVPLRPRQGGLLVPEVTELGIAVQGGQALGRIISPYSFAELEIFRCPV